MSHVDDVFYRNSHWVIILRACNLFDLFVFSAHLTGCFSVFIPQQNRHPERSAAQIYRNKDGSWRVVEGPRRRLCYPCCSELFNHRSLTTGSCCGTQWMAGHSTMLESSWFPAPGKVRGGFARCGLPRLKSSEEHRPTSIAGVPSATFGTGSSTARHKRCVRRSICEALRSG
jgi:hypothetical protein